MESNGMLVYEMISEMIPSGHCYQVTTDPSLVENRSPEPMYHLVNKFGHSWPQGNGHSVPSVGTQLDATRSGYSLYGCCNVGMVCLQ